MRELTQHTIWSNERYVDDMCESLAALGRAAIIPKFRLWIEQNKPAFETALTLGSYRDAYIFVLSQIDA